MMVFSENGGRKKKLTDIGLYSVFSGYLEISFWTVNSGHWMIEEVRSFTNQLHNKYIPVFIKQQEHYCLILTVQ